jgi:hypothetical protein
MVLEERRGLIWVARNATTNLSKGDGGGEQGRLVGQEEGEEEEEKAEARRETTERAWKPADRSLYGARIRSIRSVAGR